MILIALSAGLTSAAVVILVIEGIRRHSFIHFVAAGFALSASLFAWGIYFG